MNNYYTFELSENVTRTAVSYPNRYGIRIAADLYTSKYMDETAKHPALVIGPPYGGVKEQGPGVYANQLAQRGFVCLAFDPAFMGEPRHVSSPDIFAENFSAGVDLSWYTSLCGSGADRRNWYLRQRRVRSFRSAGGYPHQGSSYGQYVRYCRWNPDAI